MHEQKEFRFLLLFSAFIMLAACQLQLNKAGNALDFRVLAPGRASGSTSNAKSLAGGTGVTLTITTQAGAQWETSPVLAINGSSVSYTFGLPPTGSYLASAELFDGSGNLISQASTPFAVPVQTNPVTLSVQSGQVVVSYLGTPIYNYNGSYYDLIYFNTGTPPQTIQFSVLNDGSNTLYPFGSNPVTVTNTSGYFFLTSQLPSTPIPPGGTSYFAIECIDPLSGPGTETVTLRTSDPTNTPFVFQITSSGS